MYIRANAEVVLKTEVHGYVVRGPTATHLEPSEGIMVDVEAVYAVDESSNRVGPNIVADLSAAQMEQIEEALADAYEAQNG